MNTSLSPSSLHSSNASFEAGPAIRDTIFYFEDLMGDRPILPKAAVPAQEDDFSLIMAKCFDEAMFDHEYHIQSLEREQEIKDLLKSIEDFQQDGFDEE